MRFFFLYLLGTFVFAQEHYFVSFKDKPPVEKVYSEISGDKILRHWKKAIPLNEKDLPVNSEYVKILKENNIKILARTRWFNGVYIEATEKKCKEIKELPFVKAIRKVQKYYVRATGNSQNIDYGQSLNFMQQINLDCLHQKGYTGQNIKAGVFDSGFFAVDTSYFYDSLRVRNGIFATWDFQNQETNVYNDGTHGGMVFSIMAANVPGQYVGGAPHASYFLARTEVGAFERHVEEYNWLAAVEYGDSLGIEVINSSLGYNTFDPGEGDYSYSDMDGNTTIISQAADLAAAKGIVVVTSAGNEGNSAWKKITAPCDADSALCVGAVDINGNYASFSSQGPSADGQIKPDVVAQGAGTRLVYGASVTASSGTSFSSPVVAGMVICLLSAFPMAKPMDIIDAVRKSASQYNKPDSLFGYGIPDACSAFSFLTLANIPQNLPPDTYLKALLKNNRLFFTLFSKHRFSYASEIFNIQGQVVLREASPKLTNFQYEIPLTSLPPGMYFLRIKSETGQIFLHKFIKY